MWPIRLVQKGWIAWPSLHLKRRVKKMKHQMWNKERNKEFSSLQKQIVSLIVYMAPRGNIHKEIKKLADGITITYSRLQWLDSGFLERTTAPMKTNEQKTTPSRVKDTGVPKVQAQGGEANGTPANGRRSFVFNLRAKRRGKSREG